MAAFGLFAAEPIVPPPELVRLFLPAEAATAPPVFPAAYAQVWRLNPAIAPAREQMVPGSQFRLHLVGDAPVTVTVEHTEKGADGELLIDGRADDDPDSTVALSLGETGVSGTVNLGGGGHFHLTARGDTVEVRKSLALPAGGCATDLYPVTAIPSGPAAGRLARAAAASPLPAADTLPDPTVIDVLFLYTPLALAGASSEARLQQDILGSIESTHRLYTNSGIHVRLNPIRMELINYTESGSMITDLNRLISGNEGLEKSAALRESYKADVVFLITETDNNNWAGYAYGFPVPTGDPTRAFSVFRRGFINYENVVAHELGHILGCAHDREHAGDLNDTAFWSARKPYLFGHRFEVEGVTYRDIMSYDPGIALPNFSTPRLSLDGVPQGVAEGGDRPADGARTINEMAPYVALYRTALSRIEFTAPQFTAPEDGGSVTVGLRRSGDLNTRTRVNVIFEPTSVAKVASDYLRPTSTLVEFATNQATAELVIPILADELAEGSETLRLSLVSVLGSHGLGQQPTAEVVIMDGDSPTAFSAVEFPDGSLALPETATAARVRVRLPALAGLDPSVPVEVPYRTEDGTATAPQQYVSAMGTVPLFPGGNAVEIPIPLGQDPGPSADRTFRLVVGWRTNEVRILDQSRPGSAMATGFPALEADGGMGATRRADGTYLVWGPFSRLAGRDVTGVARLKADGSFDETFTPPEFLLGHRRMEGVGNADVRQVVPLADGSMLVAGVFSRIGGQKRSMLVRLKADGSLDESFGQNLRFDGNLIDLAVQADGKVVVVGAFGQVNGEPHSALARLNSDGTLDSTFRPAGGPSSSIGVLIFAVAVQPDGKILIGGSFEKVDGQVSPNFARLNADGTFDTTTRMRGGVVGPVVAIHPLPDGRTLLGGDFVTVGGRAMKRVARLNPDGSNDTSFRSPNPNAQVWQMVPLPDGRSMISGFFTQVSGKPRRFLALLERDGSLAPEFDTGLGLDSPLSNRGIAVDPRGSAWLFGSGSRFNGESVRNVAQIRLGSLAPVVANARIESGQWLATVHGILGGVYPVESSADLSHWHADGEVRLDGNSTKTELVRPVAPGSEFFRLGLPQP